jgi:hypothetical protein
VSLFASFFHAATLYGMVLYLLTPGHAQDPWPMFHGNAKHTGRSPHIGPATADAKWTNPFETDGNICSSPAVGRIDDADVVYTGPYEDQNFPEYVMHNVQATYTLGLVNRNSEPTIFTISAPENTDEDWTVEIDDAINEPVTAQVNGVNGYTVEVPPMDMTTMFVKVTPHEEALDYTSLSLPVTVTVGENTPETNTCITSCVYVPFLPTEPLMDIPYPIPP